MEAGSILTAYLSGIEYAATFDPTGDGGAGTFTMTVPEITGDVCAIVQIQTGTEYRYHEITEL